MSNSDLFDKNEGLRVTKWRVKDKLVPLVCLLSPFATYYIGANSEVWLNYTFGFELLILNGFITFLGLTILKEKKKITF